MLSSTMQRIRIRSRHLHLFTHTYRIITTPTGVRPIVSMITKGAYVHETARGTSPTTRPEGYMTIAPTRLTRPEGYMLTIICIHVAQFSPEGCTTAAHGITYYPSTQTLNTSHPCRSCTHLHNSTSPCLGGYAPPLLYITHSVCTTPQSNRRP
jgi:hypothetical protein